ncbi:MAG: Ig-like domain-containing protein, partial [Planctomycetota bacterium]
ADGTITYTPFTDSRIDDQFRYRVRDNSGALSTEAIVSISPNAAPIANDDAQALFRNEAVNIPVTDNDTDADFNDAIDLTSIQITRLPRFGTATPISDGSITYEPSTNFVGIDSFEYTVADSEGRRSSPATVNLQVVASRLQNPIRNNDVNDNGEVSALDALLIINHLNRFDTITNPTAQQDLDVTAEDQIGQRNPETGQIITDSFYYDTTGDLRISSLDALRIINELNARDTSGTGSNASSEPIAAGDGNVLAASSTAPGEQTLGAELAEGQPSMETVLAEATKVVGDVSEVELPVEVLDLLVTDDDDDDSAEIRAAVDAAMSRII